MNKIKTILKEHTLISIYFIVFCILLNGIFIHSGTKYLLELSLFIFPLFLFYFGISYWKNRRDINLLKPFDRWKNKIPPNLDLILGGVCVILIIFHLISLGGSPALKGLSMNESGEVAELRKNITANSSVLWGYISSFNIKAILPFTLLLFFYKKKNTFFILLYIIGAFYAFSLMQKSYILTVSLPIFLYLLINKKIIKSIGILAICGVVIFSLVYITNPQMRGGKDTIEHPEVAEVVVEEEDDADKDAPYYVRVVYGLGKRMFVVPGEMVVQWFEAIPEKKPFLNGTGYRFYCSVTGKEFREYSKELYPIIRPQYVERGYEGSVNVASFMYEYSNFGKIGMVLSALFFSIVLLFTEAVFKGNLKIKVALNLFPVFMLSSGALTTALFSGGWGLVILLYFVFSNSFNAINEK